MQEKSVQENKMGYVPVNKLLLSMSVPMMISMMVMALYNVVDSVFVSYIGENALAAVSLAFPIQNLMIAISVGTSVGVNALLSKSLGEKKQQAANQAADNGLFLTLLGSIAFFLFGAFFSYRFFEGQTNIPEIVEFGGQYMFIICIFSFGMFFQIMLEKLLISTGKTIYTMYTQGFGAIINIILDPVFIFGIGSIPKMGVAGAAVATVIGQIGAMLLALYFNISKNHEIRITLKGFRPHWETIKRIYSVGIPSILMASIGSIMILALNAILMSFSATATAVFGIYFKLQSFVFMPVFGLNNGMVPIISYNYGAEKKKRITDTVRYSVYYAVGIMAVGLAIFQLIPDTLLSLFNASEDMLSIGSDCLRIISLSFVMAGFSIVASSVFQALGNGMASLFIAIARQLVVLVPVAYLLSLSGSLSLVWWSFPIAEVVALILSAIFLANLFRKKVAPMPDIAE